MSRMPWGEETYVPHALLADYGYYVLIVSVMI